MTKLWRLCFGLRGVQGHGAKVWQVRTIPCNGATRAKGYRFEGGICSMRMCVGAPAGNGLIKCELAGEHAMRADEVEEERRRRLVNDPQELTSCGAWCTPVWHRCTTGVWRVQDRCQG